MLEEEDEDNMFSSIPNDFSLLHDEHFPLFVTYGKLMSMLHGTIVASIDDEAFMDFSDSDSTGEEGNRFNFPSEVMEMQRFLGGRVVTYELFERSYWPKFDKRTTSTFDSVLVWSEIMSLIKVQNLICIEEATAILLFFSFPCRVVQHFTGSMFSTMQAY